MDQALYLFFAHDMRAFIVSIRIFEYRTSRYNFRERITHKLRNQSLLV
jgi:hypothetical protein